MNHMKGKLFNTANKILIIITPIIDLFMDNKNFKLIPVMTL